MSIARNRRAQLDLIDKHLTLELRNHQHEVNDTYSYLNTQTEGLTNLESIIRDRSSYQRDLALYIEKINELNDELNKIKELQQSDAVTSHQLWNEEKTYLVGLVNSIDKTKSNIEASFEKMELPILDVPSPEKETPNREVIDKCKSYASEITKLKSSTLEMILQGLDEVETKIRKDASLWRVDYDKHNKEYSELTAGHGGLKTKELNDQIELLGRKKFDAQAKLNSIDLAEKEYNRLIKIRKEYIATIKDKKSRIATSRERKVKEIIKNVPRLRIVLRANANRDDYKALLQESISMKGSNQKQHIVETICKEIDPFQLAELVRANDYVLIDKKAKIGSWAQKIVEQLRADPSLTYKIEAVPTEDYLEISLDVGNGDFRPLEKLSTGQKATVIVSLSLVEGSSPILFDQPEDALYSPFIVENIVHLVKASKDKRQFIFATHNPNIAVGPDLDLGIVLEGSSNETTIKAAGGMDDTETNKLGSAIFGRGRESYSI